MKNRNAISRSRGDVIFDVVNHTIMLLILIIILYPLYFIVLASVTDPDIVSGLRGSIRMATNRPLLTRRCGRDMPTPFCTLLCAR